MVRKILQSIISLNAKGVSSLAESGNCANAASLFQQGIDKVKHHFPCSIGKETDRLGNRDAYSLHNENHFSDPETALLTIGQIITVPIPDHVEQSSSFIINTNAMTILLERSTEKTHDGLVLANEPENREMIALLYSILLYNMGLCYHIQGLSSGKDSFFQEASKAYDTSFGRVGTLIATMRKRQHDCRKDLLAVLLLQLFLLNNCGHIYHHFLYAKELHHCLEIMEHVLRSVKHEYGWEKCGFPQEFNSFIMNVSLHATTYSRHAPAA